MIHVIDKAITELTSTELVSRTEVKTHLNITDTGWDSEIDVLITQCRKAVEDYTGRSLIYKRITIYADYQGEWWLPFPPVIGLEYVGSKDGTVGSGIPSFTTVDEWQITGGESPKFTSPLNDLHKITYTAGYTTLPANLKLALLNEIYYRFENKGQTRVDGLCDAARALAAPFVRYEYSV